MDAVSFEKLKKAFLLLGGDSRVLKNIGSSTGLRAEALLKYHIRKLEDAKKVEQSSAKQSNRPKGQVYAPAFNSKDFISEYPVELHAAYLRRREVFLEACSLKVQLNALADNEILQAGRLQWEIFHRFQEFDKYEKALRHYRDTKRIMPTETKEDFSDVPDKLLHLKLRNLRSLKTNRKKTLRKLKANLPEPDQPEFKMKLDEINRKIEELATLDLQIEKLSNKIGVL